MKHLEIPFLSDARGCSLPQHSIDVENWRNVNQSCPLVRFQIHHDAVHLFVGFSVKEDSVRAVHDRINAPVYEDSCVEFFFQKEASAYLNFEFNAIGTCLAASGPDRAHRELLSTDAISTIRTHSSLGTTPFEERGECGWNLEVAIPFALLGLGRTAVRGLEARGNFYKCGNALRRPHYLSWNRIASAKPDFHRPEAFGTLLFR